MLCPAFAPPGVSPCQRAAYWPAPSFGRAGIAPAHLRAGHFTFNGEHGIDVLGTGNMSWGVTIEGDKCINVNTIGFNIELNIIQPSNMNNH